MRNVWPSWPDPLLGEDHRARRAALDGDRRNERDRGGDDERRHGNDDVECSLGDGVPAATLDLLDVDQRAPTEILGAESHDVDVTQTGRESHVVAGVGELAGQAVDDLWTRPTTARSARPVAPVASRMASVSSMPPSTLTPPRSPMSSGPTNPTTR